MSLVKDYGLNNLTDQDFRVTFSIPDNCEYTVTDKNGVVVIEVQLQTGQTQPSSNFEAYHADVTAENEELYVDFEQILDNVTNTRPKMKVENC